MKKTLSTFAGIFMLVRIFAQTPCNTVNGVTIDVGENCYIIDIEYPTFEMAEKSLYSSFAGEQVYAYADFGFDEEENSPFKYKQWHGGPEIPFVSINLQIPDGAYVGDAIIDNIVYGDSISIDWPYLPVQNPLETYEDTTIIFQEELYTNNELREPVVISGPYTYMGTTGINIKFKPFIYDYTHYRVCPIISIRYIVCVSGTESLLSMYQNTIEQEHLAEAVNFYNTYCHDERVNPNYKGNYLIITTPAFETEAELYAQHKINLGYNAWVEVVSPYYCNSTYIRNRLKYYVDNENTRPKYILIIGSGMEGTIPFSYGSYSGTSNPLTDIYYACLEYPLIEDEIYLTPDVYVGRWPVNNSNELQNIMNKSIYYDLIIPNSRRFAIFTGTGDTQYLRFAEASIYIRNLIQNDATHNTCIHYDGADGFNSTYMTYEFENYNDLMLAYRGHGSENGFGSPFNSINRYSLPENLPYFTFSIACMTGYPNGLGVHWINDGDRSVTFYGATVNTYRNDNNVFEKTIFNGLKDTTNYTIGEFIYRGINEYFLNGGSNLEIRSYVLYGDPSLYIYGMDFLGNPAKYVHGKNTVGTDFVEELPKEFRYKLYTLVGYLVKSGTVESLDQISKLDLTSGIYIISVTNAEGKPVLTDKMIIKQ